MRIMEIVSGAGVNGAIVHCLELTRELARRGHELTLVCRPQAWIGEQLRPAGVEVIESELNSWPTGELKRSITITRGGGGLEARPQGLCSSRDRGIVAFGRADVV